MKFAHLTSATLLLLPFSALAAEHAPVPGRGFIILLALHIVLGLVGIGAIYAIAMSLLKKAPNLRFLKWSTLIAVISFFISWVSSGIYYVKYYGGPVKSAIKTGAHPWAHNFFMETKEHVFLLLPFISLTLFFAVWWSSERIISDEKLRRTLAWIAIIGSLIGIFSTLSGVIISGSV